MNICRVVLCVVVLTSLTFGFGSRVKEGASSPSQSSSSVSPSVIELSVSGMTCGGCASKVVSSCRAVSGVQSVDVDHVSGRVRVQYKKDANVTSSVLKQEIEKLGYTVQ